MIDLSVVIPTKDRLGLLGWCLEGVSRAAERAGREGISAEVVVSVDGPDEGEGASASARLGGVPTVVLSARPGDAAGPAAARNRALDAVRGEIVLFLNDDAAPDEACFAEHARAHAALGGRAAMVLGDAPWEDRPGKSAFDALVERTSTIFFYDVMHAAEPDPGRDWGFRHAWTLNLSLPTALARSAGGFTTEMARPVYEDLEFAHRCVESGGAPVLYRPEARVVHRHRYEPEGLLRRDALLGHQAVRLARINPACARAMFGRDLFDTEWAYVAARSLERTRSLAVRSAALLSDLTREPEPAGGPSGAAALRGWYLASQHARRWAFDAGLVAAHAGRSADEAGSALDELLAGAGDVGPVAESSRRVAGARV